MIADGTSIGTIQDDGTGPGGTDDDRPIFSVDDVTVNEAAGTLTFTVTRTGATALASSVDYATADGTATSGADYARTSGTLDFLPGETSKTVSIVITNDNLFELAETFSLNLSHAGNAVVGAATGSQRSRTTVPEPAASMTTACRRHRRHRRSLSTQHRRHRAVIESLGSIETVAGFPLLGSEIELPDLRHELTLERDIPEQPMPVNGGQMSFTIPTDTFVHTDSTAQVRLAATMVDGSALPAWLKFDASTGTFSGTAPRSVSGDLQIKVLARDDIGRQAETIVRVAGEASVSKPPSSADLTAGDLPVNSDRSAATVNRQSQADPSPLAQGRQAEPAGSAAPITTVSGFRVLVDAGARGAADHELRLHHAIPDQAFPANLLLVRYQVPIDAFIHTDIEARVVLAASMIDGSGLPTWLVFDAGKGEFKGMPPLGFRGDLLIKVVARDAAGRQAETIVRISIGDRDDKVAVGAKAGLTAQLRPLRHRRLEGRTRPPDRACARGNDQGQALEGRLRWSHIRTRASRQPTRWPRWSSWRVVRAKPAAQPSSISSRSMRPIS